MADLFYLQLPALWRMDRAPTVHAMRPTLECVSASGLTPMVIHDSQSEIITGKAQTRSRSPCGSENGREASYPTVSTSCSQ